MDVGPCLFELAGVDLSTTCLNTFSLSICPEFMLSKQVIGAIDVLLILF